MSSRTSVKLDSKIFASNELKCALSAVALRQAKKFAKDLGEKMENSPHTGRTVTKARGETFRVRHQQSRRGERPAPFSKSLELSIKARATGENSARVDSDSDYANKLIFEDGRVIVSGDDLEEARKGQASDLNGALLKFL